MEGEPIDLDRGNLLPETTIHVFNYLDNSWRAAVVQEVDTAEREILVNYDDETQEWIGVDGRKICFPPVDKSECIPSDSTVHKRVKSSRTRKKSIDFKSHSVKEKPLTNSNLLKKKHSSTTVKSAKQSDTGRKIMSKSSPGSAFLRLKFKPNSKNGKPSVKSEASKKRKREKQHIQDSVENSSQIESDEQDIKVRKVVPKVSQSRLKEPRKDACRLKIRIGRNEAGIISVNNSTTATAENVEPLAFNTSSEKKIKTLLPKRSVSETVNKAPLEVLSPESSVCSSPLLPSTCPTSTTPTLNLLPTSSGYVCPKQDCKKQFRNENLLMMHIKHYHREYRSMLHSMPNVADLAYARTVGEHIESPQANYLEKIVKLEEHRLNKPDEIEQSNLGQKTFDEQVDNVSRVDETLSWNSNRENVGETMKSTPKPSQRRASSSKRSGGSESSPKLPLLMAQLQGPPLVPSSLNMESDSVDVGLSLSQKKPSSVLSPQLSERSDSLIDSDEKPDGGRKTPKKKRRLSQLDSTDVINCGCGYGFEDGLMIQCDLCQCWQHGSCVGFENEADVPSNYTCETCQFSKRCHSSRRYSYVQNWLREGTMPKFEFNSQNEEVQQKREKIFKLSHVLLCELTDLRLAIRSLQLKIQILRQSPDHPKLYLWAQSWDDHTFEKEEKERNRLLMDSGPVPEVPINMTDCRKHLSEHINTEIEKADNVLRDIEHRIEKLDELENAEGGNEDNWNNGMDKYVSIVKQTLLMMLRDLTSLQALKYCHQ